MCFGQRSLLGEAKVDRIKRHNQVFRVIHLLECANNSRLSANSPSKILVRYGILEAHALLVDQREPVLVDGRRVVTIITKVASELG